MNRFKTVLSLALLLSPIGSVLANECTITPHRMIQMDSRQAMASKATSYDLKPTVVKTSDWKACFDQAIRFAKLLPFRTAEPSHSTGTTVMKWSYDENYTFVDTRGVVSRFTLGAARELNSAVDQNQQILVIR